MRRAEQGGFTMVELMVALTVLLIGLMVLLATVVTSVRASSFSRHATEAAVLGEDKLEELRTRTVVPGTVTETPLDEQGFVNTDRGVFTRTSVVTAKSLFDSMGNGFVDSAGVNNFYEIQVTVSWLETGEDTPRTLVLTTERIP